jgi:hypothetical protein
MKHFGKLALLGAALAVSATYVYAAPIMDQISIAGTDSYTLTSVSFGSTLVFGAINGPDFQPYFTDGQAVAMTGFTFSPLSSPQQVFQIVETGETLTYFLTSLNAPYIDATGNLTLIGQGYFNESGSADSFTNVPGTFDLTSPSRIRAISLPLNRAA